MAEQLTILQHATNRLAKLWRQDGTIAPYDDAKYFTRKKAKVDGIEALHDLLTKLETRPQACMIRGQYIGDERAAVEDPEYKEGRVRRVLAVFEDRPLHSCLVEVDNFEPLSADPVTDPLGAVEEYVYSSLPEAFHGITYHWQLSNSAGAPGNEDKLKAHIWFWLETPYTSAQLRAWSKTLPPDTLDASVLNPVQVHYTSAPVFEKGVNDPVPVRSGFVEGVLGDAVELVIDEATLAGAQDHNGKETRQAKLRNAIDDDPIVHLLHEKGMVKGKGTQGQLNIVCPCEDQHTSDGGPTSTVYYPPNTGGYAKGAFVCLHDHCRETPQREFQLALGYDDILDEFTDFEEGSTGADMLEAGASGEMVFKDIPEAKHLTTDLRNAQRIMEKFKGRLIVTADRWYAWVGTHWAQDDGEVYASAVKLSKIIHAEADDWEMKALEVCQKRIGGSDITKKWLHRQMADKKLVEELPGEAVRDMLVADSLRKWAAKSEMRSAIENALHLAKKMLNVPADKLNADPWLFNCPNGTVDLRTGAVRGHRPADYITHCAPVAYDPNAEAPIWERTVARVTCEDGQGDQPLAAFLRRWFGYCATASTREQCFVVHWGSGGNGKSTILGTIGRLLNGYAGTAPSGLLTSRKNDNHPTEVASLLGKRMVTAHESDEGAVLREGFVKQATGEDEISARFMRGDFFEFMPTHKIQLLTNHKPIIKSQDPGIWRRILLVPYLTRFGTPAQVAAGLAHYEKDKTVADHIEREQAGILNWVVRGAVEWYRDGLNPPEVVLAASETYKGEQDRVAQFVMECCEVGKGEEYSTPLAGAFGGLYPAYKSWCEDAGIRPLAKNRMLVELERVVPHLAKNSVLRDDGFGKRRRIMQVEGVKLLGED